MAENVVVLLKNELGRKLAEEKCVVANLDLDVFEKLIEAELGHAGKKAKVGITQQFDEIFGALDAKT